jgi:lipoprotein NlpI
MIKAFYDWDWHAADNSFKRALELNPGYAFAHNQYGMFLCVIGRFQDTQTEMNRAYELDPLSDFFHVGTVEPVYFARRWDLATQQLLRMVALTPDAWGAHLNLGWFTRKLDCLTMPSSPCAEPGI